MPCSGFAHGGPLYTQCLSNALTRLLKKSPRFSQPLRLKVCSKQTKRILSLLDNGLASQRQPRQLRNLKQGQLLAIPSH
jgi:hypothetical protein